MLINVNYFPLCVFSTFYSTKNFHSGITSIFPYLSNIHFLFNPLNKIPQFLFNPLNNKTARHCYRAADV